jgi:hypothetical protein
MFRRTGGRISDEARSRAICSPDRRNRRDGGDHQWASPCCSVLSIHQLSRELCRKTGSPARRTSGCACCGTFGHSHESRRSRQPCRSPLSIIRRHAPLSCDQFGLRDAYADHGENDGSQKQTGNAIGNGAPCNSGNFACYAGYHKIVTNPCRSSARDLHIHRCRWPAVNQKRSRPGFPVQRNFAE